MPAKSYIDLKLPSIMGMGAVGPTLAIITATLYSALCASVDVPAAWAYPVIMLVLSGFLAVFPVAQAVYPNWQKACLWPVTAAIIFSTAWGTNNGLSAGEKALAQSNWSIPDISLVPSAYAGTNDPVEKPTAMIVNSVDFSRVDYGSKVKADQKRFARFPVSTWAVQWVESDRVYLKDGQGVWSGYLLMPKVAQPSDPAPPESVKESAAKKVQQSPVNQGFFKRF